MEELLRSYNLKHEEAVGHLQFMLKQNEQLYNQVRIRCVSTEVTGAWHNALCTIKIFPKDNLPEKKTSCRYRRIHLLEEWVEPSALSTTILGQIGKGVITVDDEEVLLDAHSRFNEWEYLPSNNDYSCYPGYVYKTPYGQRPQIAHYEPLLSYDLPFFPNPYFAIREWAEFGVFHMQNDARIGTIQVFLPQCQSRFEKVRLADRRLDVSIKGSQIAGLLVKGAWEHEDRCNSFQKAVTRSTASIEVPLEVEGFEIYLIGPDGVVYDYHRETKFWFIGQERILQNVPRQGTKAATVRTAIKRGEGESIEFKPYIRIGDTKQEELVETVIAFANTKGGIILVGVNNHGIVEGIEKDVAKKASKRQSELRDELSKYLRWLKQSIGEKLNRTLDLEISTADLEGHSIALIDVLEGQEKPYAHVQTKAIYVRRGAHNVYPDPDFELPQLMKSSLDKRLPQ